MSAAFQAELQAQRQLSTILVGTELQAQQLLNTTLLAIAESQAGWLLNTTTLPHFADQQALAVLTTFVVVAEPQA